MMSLRGNSTVPRASSEVNRSRLGVQTSMESGDKMDVPESQS